MTQFGRKASALLVLVGIATDVDAGKFNKKLSVGDTAPAWTDLTGVDGNKHSLKDYESKFLVIVFTCNQCPVAAGYQARFNKLAREYKDQGLSVVAINVNRGRSESLEKMANRAAQDGLKFHYLKDESQASAKEYGVRNTPTVFLLDADRRIAYMGAVDDNWEAEDAVEHHYLWDAVRHVVAGTKPEVTESRPAGCAISYQPDNE